jgi:hypothetical protein
MPGTFIESKNVSKTTSERGGGGSFGEPVSAHNSLQTGKSTGNLTKIGPIGKKSSEETE